MTELKSTCWRWRLLSKGTISFDSPENHQQMPHFQVLLLESIISLSIYFSSVQFSHWVVSDSLRPHESQHARPPCPSPTPGVHSDSRPSSQWCHPAISSSVSPSPPAPNPSQHQSLFQWVNSSHEVAWLLTCILLWLPDPYPVHCSDFLTPILYFVLSG